MTDKTFYSMHFQNEGWSQPGVETYKWEYFGATALDPGRNFFTRFPNVDLPSGATFVSAQVVYMINAKNGNDPQTFTYNHFYEQVSFVNIDQDQDSTPLRLGNTEETSRNWRQTVTGGTFTWNHAIGHADYQELSVDVTASISQALGTNHGRHMMVTFRMECTADGGDHNIGNGSSGYPARLIITYTGGTARNEVVVWNENPNFVVPGPGPGGEPMFWYNNTVFGTFQDPTYSTPATDGAIAPPFGGNLLKVTSTVANRAVALYDAPNHLPPSQWYHWSGYVYAPTGVPDIQITSFQSLWSSAQEIQTSVKDQWVRLHVPFLAGSDLSPLYGFSTMTAQAIGTSFYIANVNITQGRELYPYFDGNTTDTATFHRTFDWGGGDNGHLNGGVAYVTLDNAPTATPFNPQPNMSTQDRIRSRWTYSDPYSESSSRYRIEIKKKRMP